LKRIEAVELLRGKIVQMADRDIFTIVQPDVCVICDLAKIDNRGCNGAPDLIVEVVSASTKQRDFHEKKDLYAEAGVLEYWIVLTESKILLTHCFLLQKKMCLS
jgi:Uma2 family endonuclease